MFNGFTIGNKSGNHNTCLICKGTDHQSKESLTQACTTTQVVTTSWIDWNAHVTYFTLLAAYTRNKFSLHDSQTSNITWWKLHLVITLQEQWVDLYKTIEDDSLSR
jgi:hypothetical protein